MKIQCIDQTVRKILSSGIFVVPRFQRPFSWDKENVEELWDDAVIDEKKGYFIGSFVTYDMQDGKYGIVDGQQRITCITIALCVIRDKFSELGEKQLALGVQNLVETKGLRNELQYIVRTETSYPYFQLKIQSFEKDNEKVEIRNEESSLAAAHEVLKEKVNQGVEFVMGAQIDDLEQGKKDAVKWLATVRDKFLSLQVVSITLANQNDAYTIFETMNTRGKDLTPADLVKNHILRLIPAKGAQIDRAKEKWLVMQRELETAPRKIPMSEFLHHYWMSKYSYTTAKGVFKQFSINVDKSNAASYFDEMIASSKLYRAIDDPDILSIWNPNTFDIRESLQCISNVLNVQVPNPLLLSALRQYTAGHLRDGQLRDLLELIEKYHYIYSTINGGASSGGMTRMYSGHARAIAAATTKAEFATAISDFKKKLKIPSKDTFVSRFKKLSYSEFRRKEVLKYTLWKIEKHRSPALALDRETGTFEHIASQSNKLSNGHSIGNLLLVPAKFNGEILGNKDFLEKKQLLQGSGVNLEPEILNANHWGEAEIETRLESLANYAYDHVWKI